MAKISPTARYPHAVDITISPEDYETFLLYLEVRADEERVARWKKTDGGRELLSGSLRKWRRAYEKQLASESRLAASTEDEEAA